MHSGPTAPRPITPKQHIPNNPAYCFWQGITVADNYIYVIDLPKAKALCGPLEEEDRIVYTDSNHHGVVLLLAALPLCCSPKSDIASQATPHHHPVGHHTARCGNVNLIHGRFASWTELVDTDWLRILQVAPGPEVIQAPPRCCSRRRRKCLYAGLHDRRTAMVSSRFQ